MKGSGLFLREKASTPARGEGQWWRSKAGDASKNQAANRFICLGGANQSVAASLKPCAEDSDAGSGGVQPHGRHAKFKYRTSF